MVLHGIITYSCAEYRFLNDPGLLVLHISSSLYTTTDISETAESNCAPPSSNMMRKFPKHQ